MKKDKYELDDVTLDKIELGIKTTYAFGDGVSLAHLTKSVLTTTLAHHIRCCTKLDIDKENTLHMLDVLQNYFDEFMEKLKISIDQDDKKPME